MQPPNANTETERWNVLLIEDDESNRRVVRDMLDVAGVSMIEAENAKVGLHLLDVSKLDIILIDLRMDGLTAIGRIRARGDAKGRVPVVVVTADTAVDVRRQCLIAGANDVIFKPVAMDALFEALGRLLAGHADLPT